MKSEMLNVLITFSGQRRNIIEWNDLEIDFEEKSTSRLVHISLPRWKQVRKKPKNNFLNDSGNCLTNLFHKAKFSRNLMLTIVKLSNRKISKFPLQKIITLFMFVSYRALKVYFWLLVSIVEQGIKLYILWEEQWILHIIRADQHCLINIFAFQSSNNVFLKGYFLLPTYGVFCPT